MAEAYFSNMTEGRPCSVVLGVSSTIPLKAPAENVHVKNLYNVNLVDFILCTSPVFNQTKKSELG